MYCNESSEIFSPIESDTSSAYTTDNALLFRTARGSANAITSSPTTSNRVTNATTDRTPVNPPAPATCIHQTQGVTTINQNAGKYVNRNTPRHSSMTTVTAYTTTNAKNNATIHRDTLRRGVGHNTLIAR
jgi:hypothetical protein